jgi:hypothetical protein
VWSFVAACVEPCVRAYWKACRPILLNNKTTRRVERSQEGSDPHPTASKVVETYTVAERRDCGCKEWVVA